MSVSLISPRKGLKGVVVSGKTAPGLRVYLGGTRITKYIDEQNVQFVQMTRDTVAHLPATTDRFGLFYFQIFLDQGNYQIPIVVQDPEVPGPKGIKRYQLIFLVEEDRIRMGRASRRVLVAASISPSSLWRKEMCKMLSA